MHAQAIALETSLVHGRQRHNPLLAVWLAAPDSRAPPRDERALVPEQHAAGRGAASQQPLRRDGSGAAPQPPSIYLGGASSLAISMYFFQDPSGCRLRMSRTLP